MKIIVDTPEEYAAWLKENAPKTIVQAVKNAAAEAKAADNPSQSKDSSSTNAKDTTVVAQAGM